MRDDEVSVRARALGEAIEPVAGQVYFSPECHGRYQALGFGPSPGLAGGVALPDGPAYFCSRGSVLGQVPGEVIASAFGVFNPAAEIGLLTELYWGLPARTYVRTRAWSDADLDAAESRLTERGLLAGGALTDTGRAAREEVERATDRQCRPAIEGLGDGFEMLVGILLPWGEAIRAAGGYLASGPHALARSAAH